MSFVIKVIGNCLNHLGVPITYKSLHSFPIWRRVELHKYIFNPIRIKKMRKTSRNCSLILEALANLTGMSMYSFSLQVTYGFEKSALNWKREQTNDK